MELRPSPVTSERVVCTPSFRGAPSPLDHPPRAILPLALLLILALLVLPSRPVLGTTYPVTQEWVFVGTTTGVSGAQADDGMAEQLREADTVADPVAYPGTETLTVGTRTGAFPSALQDADGVYLTYGEATTSPPTTVQNSPGQTGVVCDWTGCSDGRIRDNAYATSNTSGSQANYHTFGLSLPPVAVNIRVEVGFEAFLSSGIDRMDMSISWDGGNNYCPAQSSGGLPMADPNSYSYGDFTNCGGAHSWTAADFSANNIHTRFIYVQVGPADVISLDANVVRVTYQLPAYELSLRYDFAAVTAGRGYTLSVVAAISDEDVRLQVLTPPASWNDRLTITGVAFASLTYSLAPGEFNSGNVAIRFVDALGTDGTQSNLLLDQVKLTTTLLGYNLDVQQNVTGITGTNHILSLKGNVSAGGENFNVHLWNFTSGAWDMRLNGTFSSLSTYQNLTLAPGYVSASTVRLRYLDAVPNSQVPGTLSLEFVGVVASAPPPLPDLALAMGDVVLSKANPSQGDVVSIDVIVANLGPGNATSILVQFAVGAVVASSGSIPSLQPGARATLSFTWTVGEARDLTFTVDPQDNIKELDEGNNQVRLHAPPPGMDLVVIGAIGGGIAAAILLLFFFFILPRRRRGSETPEDRGRGILPGIRTKPRGPAPPRARPPSFDLRPGHTYLVEEEKPDQSLKIFEGMLQGERKGLLISRRNPRALWSEGRLKGVKSYWLADARGGSSADGLVLAPSLESILFTVDEFLKESGSALVLIDGVEFLVDNNNFNAVLRFLRRLVDMVSQDDRILVVSVSPGTLQERELKNLEREMDILRLT